MQFRPKCLHAKPGRIPGDRIPVDESRGGERGGHSSKVVNNDPGWRLATEHRQQNDGWIVAATRRPVWPEGVGNIRPNPAKNSGEKSKTKPLCQLSIRPNPLFMSSGPGKWGRMWDCRWACGLWVLELSSVNLPERRIMAPRQAASRPRPACSCDRNRPAPGWLP